MVVEQCRHRQQHLHRKITLGQHQQVVKEFWRKGRIASARTSSARGGWIHFETALSPWCVSCPLRISLQPRAAAAFAAVTQCNAETTPKIAPSLVGGRASPSNTWFLGSTRIHNPSDISIDLTVFVGFTVVTNRRTHTDHVLHLHGVWAKKVRPQAGGHKSLKSLPIFKIFSLADSLINLQ